MATYQYDSGSSTNGTTWTNWTTSAGTITNSSGTVWVQWIGSWNSPPILADWNVPVQTEEEIRVAAIAIERAAIEQLERERKRKEAEKKANDLLLSLLNTQQRKEYQEQNQVTIFQNRKPKWRLFKRPSYNVLELDDCGQPLTEHCVQTKDTPLADQLATQYLYLHANPAELLRVANHRPA